MWPGGTVFASCPGCGQVRLTSRQIEVHICENQPELSVYRFDCPSCRRTVEKPACLHVTQELLSVGARGVVWKIPAEALERHVGPPLTADDLIDLHEQLAAL